MLAYRHEYDFRNAVVVRRSCGSAIARAARRRSQPPLRQHGPDAPGGAGLGRSWRELVRPDRARVGDRRAGAQPRRGTLPPAVKGHHLDPQAPRTFRPDIIALKVRTRQSRIEVAVAARTRVYGDRQSRGRPRTDLPDRGLHPAGAEPSTSAGRPVRVEKLVGLYTSRDRAISEPLRERGQQRRRATRASTPRSPGTGARGRSSGRSATSASRASRACSTCCAFTSRTSCRCAPG